MTKISNQERWRRWRANHQKPVTHTRKPTIAEALRHKLGRAPTHHELVEDVKRILAEARQEREG